MGTKVTPQDNAVAVLGFHDGSAGQIEAWFKGATGYRIACFILESLEPLQVDSKAENQRRVSQKTEYPTSNSFLGRPLIVALDWLDQIKSMGIRKVLPLTPDNRERLRQIEMCRKSGIELVSAIHPTVTVLEGATIEPGVWIAAGCIIGYKAEIAAGALMETGAQIDHHTVVERCCQVDPGVVAAGNVTLRECCYVHTGTTIINRIEIGHDAIVGAGAVVIEDVPPRCTVVGVPAKVIKYH